MTALGILALVTALQPPAARAESLFLNRHLGPGRLDSAWNLVADARAQAPADPALLAFWAQMCIERGNQLANPVGKLAWYDRAAAAADSLRRARPDLPAGHFWWATARGSAGRLRGVVNSLGLLGPIRAAFEQSVGLDSSFALGWFALGRLYLEVPPLAGGGAAKAETFLRRATAADPHLTIARLGLAEALARLGRKADARAELQRVLGEVAPSHPAEFALSDKPGAEEMLRRLGRK